MFPPKPVCKQPKGLNRYLGCTKDSWTCVVFPPTSQVSRLPCSSTAFLLKTGEQSAPGWRVTKHIMVPLLWVWTASRCLEELPRSALIWSIAAGIAQGWGAWECFATQIFVLHSLVALPATCKTHLATKPKQPTPIRFVGSCWLLFTRFSRSFKAAGNLDTAASAFTRTFVSAPRSQASSNLVNALQQMRCSNQGLGSSPCRGSSPLWTSLFQRCSTWCSHEAPIGSVLFVKRNGLSPWVSREPREGQSV